MGSFTSLISVKMCSRSQSFIIQTPSRSLSICGSKEHGRESSSTTTTTMTVTTTRRKSPTLVSDALKQSSTSSFLPKKSRPGFESYLSLNGAERSSSSESLDDIKITSLMRFVIAHPGSGLTGFRRRRGSDGRERRVSYRKRLNKLSRGVNFSFLMLIWALNSEIFK